MKIVAPLSKVEEVPLLAKAGADEFYCGVVPREWVERFGTSAVNRRIFGNLGRLEEVKLFIDAGMDANALNRWGYVPLARAAMKGDLPMLRLLLAPGADIDARDEYGNTALYNAAHHSQPAAVRTLVGQGADLHIRNPAGENAYLTAAGHGNLPTAQFLAAQGARGESNSPE